MSEKMVLIFIALAMSFFTLNVGQTLVDGDRAQAKEELVRKRS